MQHVPSVHERFSKKCACGQWTPHGFSYGLPFHIWSLYISLLLDIQSSSTSSIPSMFAIGISLACSYLFDFGPQLELHFGGIHGAARSLKLSAWVDMVAVAGNGHELVWPASWTSAAQIRSWTSNHGLRRTEAGLRYRIFVAGCGRILLRNKLEKQRRQIKTPPRRCKCNEHCNLGIYLNVKLI